MTTLIISFCGGIAFMLGVFCTLFVINLPKGKNKQSTIEKYWEESIAEHRRQISAMERIASVLEGIRYDEKFK